MERQESKVFRPDSMTEGKRNIIHGLLYEYDIDIAEDLQEATKRIFWEAPSRE